MAYWSSLTAFNNVAITIMIVIIMMIIKISYNSI